MSRTLLDVREIIRLGRILLGIEVDLHPSRRAIASRKSTLLNYFCYSLAVFLLLTWNWQLVAATAAGISLMWLVYHLQGSSWQNYRAKLKRFWNSCDRRLTLAIASGSLGILTTYTATSIWSDTENHWLAFGSIVQGLATLTTLSLVLWQLWGKQEAKDSEKFDNLLENLTASSQLQRLIAIRKLTRLVEEEKLSSSQRGDLLDYFRLLLTAENNPTLRAAVLDGLAVLEIEEFIDRPLEMPLKIKSPHQKVELVKELELDPNF